MRSDNTSRRAALLVFLLALALQLVGAAKGPSGAAATTPPIQIIIDMHADPMFGPVPAQATAYLQWLDASNWVLDVADLHGAKVSFLSTGQFMEWVLEDPAAGHPLMQRLYGSGGQLGTHSHSKMRFGYKDWRDVGPNPSEAVILQAWADHIGAVEAVITAALGVSDPAAITAVDCVRGSHIPSDDALRIQMMADHGFTIHQQGPDEEFYVYFQHYVMNPYRPSGTHMLTHDPAGPVVLSPTATVLGLEQIHFGILQDTRLPAMQARFLLELINWLHDVHVAGSDRVWTYGWGSHCSDHLPGQPTRAALEPMLAWLDEHFVGQPAGGQTAAAYSSMTESRDAYLTWEAAHPGDTSFSYPASATDWELYPYLAPVATYLARARYDSALAPIGTVRWHTLTADSISGGPFPLYVLYTTDGVPMNVDLSTELGAANLTMVDPVSGDLTGIAAAAVEVASIGTLLLDAAVTDVGQGLPGPGPSPRLRGVPNPFNPSTTIRFELSRTGQVELRIFDVSGRLVRDLGAGWRETGPQRVRWDGRDDHGEAVATGVYLARLRLDGRTFSTKLVVLK